MPGDITYDPEEQITWDEIAPSLQDRFKRLAESIDINMDNFNNKINNYRLTISYDPPLNAEQDRDIWWDLNYDVLRAYTPTDITAQDKTYKWQYTRAAWYGGASSDVKPEVIPSPTVQWSRVKSLTWISNVASNGQYTTADENPRTMQYTANKEGYYRLRDNCMVYAYNAQTAYTHDGGQLTVVVYKQAKDGDSYGDQEEIYRVTYDSKGINQAYDEVTKLYPETLIQLKQGDRIQMVATSNRNPSSTDEVEIYQIACIYVFRMNFGDPNTPLSGGSQNNP